MDAVRELVDAGALLDHLKTVSADTQLFLAMSFHAPEVVFSIAFKSVFFHITSTIQ
jgi:hypothetical protein